MVNRIVSAGILGIGSCVPEKVLTNHDLEKMVDTSDEWIIKRTGISERRVLEKNEPVFRLGIKAAENALADSGIRAEEINAIIVTSTTPDYLTPSTSCIIQGAIGAANAAAVDINAACTGFIYGITIAQQFIATGFYKYVLVVACEGLSKVVDWEDRSTCVLFGDGAGAVVVGPVDDEYGILSSTLHADGGMGHVLTIPCCTVSEEDLEKRPHENKRTIFMDGSEVFKFAVRVMADSTARILQKTGLSFDDVRLIVPHQANIRIIDGASRRLGISADKIFTNVQKYGNISSASIPVALDEAFKSSLFTKGDNLVIVGFGGGLTWGAALIRWSR